MCGGGSKMALLGPKMAVHGRLDDVPKWSGRVQNDPKWSIQPIFDHLGPFWDQLEPFWSYYTKLDFLPKKHKVFLGESDLGQKLKFCLRWLKRFQMGPKWPQMVKNMLNWSFRIILDPRRPLSDISNPAMFGHFWPKKGFFGPSRAHDWGMARAKTASNQLCICLRIMHVRRIPKVSIFMAMTTKIVTEKAK